MADCCFFVLMVLLTFLLWGTWLNNIATANQGGCGQIRYVKFLEPEKGHYLEGHVFLNLSIGARRSCEEECLYQRECVAINVGPRITDMVVCELCNSDHFQHQKDLKPRLGWTYRGTENVCAAKPCFNNGKCFLGYTDKRYLCDCQAGYTGENCEKDVDECSNGYHDCHENATCINISGSFNCSCKPGYIGNGRVCSAPAECNTWRTKNGECCVFPFLYRGKLRNSCVFDGELWCSVTKNYDIDKLRGACEDFNLTFTTLGTQGPRGPTNTSGYQGTTLQYKISLDNGIQIWKVPLNGSYVIEAWGASGTEGRERDDSSSTRAGGKGAYMKGSFNLTHGMLLKILVGQIGSVGTVGPALPGGGGGGTFVNLFSVGALIVAGGGGGGGGGAPRAGYGVGDPGQTTEKGSQYGGSKGKGGIMFEEGKPSASFEAGAGGGLIGDGESGHIADGGKSFENGGNGGRTQSGAYGGFGGGGGGFKYPGAGGGYSGGGVFMKTGGKTIAGGGGSLNRGINQVKKEGVNGGDGKVVITLVKPEL